MPAFLISKNGKDGSDDLETIVFALDNADSQDEGIPVFTSKELAEQWLAGSEFESEYDIAVLDDLPFMFWCTEICKEGIGHLILDPSRSSQENGKGQDTIDLAGHLAWSATQLLSAHRQTG